MSGVAKTPEKQDVNLAICGHAWHGKSTLVGKTAADLGMISRRELASYEKLAAEGRDASLVFALLVFRQKDVTDKGAEAARGITVLPSFVRFEFPKHRVTVIDTPGQEEYANNRFSGMFSADVACLVVDVTDGVQLVTDQVLRVLRGYEIPLRAVALTKIDRVGYEERAYEEAVVKVRTAIRRAGLDDAGVHYIPTSAYETGRSIFDPGEGITRNSKMPWYRGPTFYQFMGTLDMKEVRPRSPLRVVIHSADMHDQVPGVGTAFTGLVETGVLKRDQELVFQPLSDESGMPVTAQVRSVELTRGHLATPGIPLAEAHPRQLIGCALNRISTRASLRELMKGRGVLAGTPDAPPRAVHTFDAEITALEKDVRVTPGAHWTLHCHADKVGCEILSMQRMPTPVWELERRRLEAEKGRPTPLEDPEEAEIRAALAAEDPNRLQPGDWAHVRLRPIRAVALEEAAKLAPLSRIVLRLDNRPVAIGRCMAILDEPKA